MTDILMPALSPTMEEGVLAKWHVKVGDVVSAGDVIAEIETDKATMEVEAVDEGEVLEILVAEGTEGVKVNTLIARLKGEEGAASPAPTSPPRDEVGGRGTAEGGGGGDPIHRRRTSPPPPCCALSPSPKIHLGRSLPLRFPSTRNSSQSKLGDRPKGGGGVKSKPRSAP
jgi:pyruvate dehydrogenase E2 component (dihydrolipoamide acetyltransferase)